MIAKDSNYFQKQQKISQFFEHIKVKYLVKRINITFVYPIVLLRKSHARTLYILAAAPPLGLLFIHISV